MTTESVDDALVNDIARRMKRCWISTIVENSCSHSIILYASGELRLNWLQIPVVYM